MCSSNGGAGTAETDRCDAAGTSAEEAPGAGRLGCRSRVRGRVRWRFGQGGIDACRVVRNYRRSSPGISSALASTLSLGESASPDNPDGISDLPSSSGTLDAWWPAGTVLRARISSTELSTSCARTPRIRRRLRGCICRSTRGTGRGTRRSDRNRPALLCILRCGSRTSSLLEPRGPLPAPAKQHFRHCQSEEGTSVAARGTCAESGTACGTASDTAGIGDCALGGFGSEAASHLLCGTCLPGHEVPVPAERCLPIPEPWLGYP